MRIFHGQKPMREMRLLPASEGGIPLRYVPNFSMVKAADVRDAQNAVKYW